MIKNIKLKLGRAPGLENALIKTTPITVFVGPNNSGKSKVLSEISQYCNTGQRNAINVIIDNIEFDVLDQNVAEKKVNKVTLKPQHSESILADNIVVGKRGTRIQINKQKLLNAFSDTNGQASHFCQWYLAYNTIILNGQNRINLINQQADRTHHRNMKTVISTLIRIVPVAPKPTVVWGKTK